MRDARESVRVGAQEAENERLRTYAERYFEIQSRLPQMVHDAAEDAIEDMTVTTCKEGCRPFWMGDLSECPGCGSTSVRSAPVFVPDDLGGDDE